MKLTPSTVGILATDSAAVSEEGLNALCRWARLQLRHRADLNEAACLEHCDPLRERAGLAQVMRDEENGAPLFSEKLAQQRDQLLSEHHVDVRERLVEQESFGLRDESAGERDALALASRELRGTPLSLAV